MQARAGGLGKFSPLFQLNGHIGDTMVCCDRCQEWHHLEYLASAATQNLTALSFVGLNYRFCNNCVYGDGLENFEHFSLFSLFHLATIVKLQ